MHLYAMEDHEEFDQPVAAMWWINGTGHLGSAVNGAPVRVGSSEGELQLMRDDMHTAWARMASGEYDRIVITDELQRMADKKKFGGALRAGLKELAEYRCSATAPPTMSHLSISELVDLHNSRTKRPARRIRVATLMCGVSGDMRALRGLGCKEEDVVMNEICPEACAKLRRDFPKARVVPGDIRKRSVQLEVLAAFKGEYDIVVVAIPCQPSSTANPHKTPDDSRLGLAMEAVHLACELDGRVTIVEDVAAFDNTQSDAYDDVVKVMKAHHNNVEVLKFDAKIAMVASTRRRMYIIASKEISLEPTVRLMQAQHTFSKCKGVRTYPTVREALKPFRNMRQIKGMFVPQLSGVPRGPDGRPRRIVSVDKFANTITGMYGTKGGASQECFKKYSTCDADEVHKSLSFCPTAADYSVLLGFARDTQWTVARSCPCEGCRHRPDSRPAPPGDKERGNSISPPSFLLLMRLLYRQVGGLPDSEALSLARQAEIQTLAFEMGEKALYAKAASYLSEGAPESLGADVRWLSVATCGSEVAGTDDRVPGEWGRHANTDDAECTRASDEIKYELGMGATCEGVQRKILHILSGNTVGISPEKQTEYGKVPIEERHMQLPEDCSQATKEEFEEYWRKRGIRPP